VFIIGPAAGSASAQNKIYDSKSVYCYDSIEVMEIARLILENDLLRNNEKEYESRDSLYELKIISLKEKVSGLESIISLKDEQIIKLENIPHEIKQAGGWQWWHYTLACIGAVTFGFTAGIIYENLK